MINVIPYIKTIGTEKFKSFLSSPFKWEMLLVDPEKDNFVVFADWELKELSDDKHHYFKSNKDQNLLFTKDYYEINGVGLPLPIIIDDFINDMTRMGVTLYWSNWVLENFEPKDMYSPEGIKQYYVDLLDKMEKGHELT